MSETFKHSAIFFNEVPKDNFLHLGEKEHVEKSIQRFRKTLERISGSKKELVRQFMQETMQDGGLFIYPSSVETLSYGLYETFDTQRKSLGRSVVLLLPLNYFFDFNSYLDMDMESMLSNVLSTVWQKAAEMDIARHNKETDDLKVGSVAPLEEYRVRKIKSMI